MAFPVSFYTFSKKGNSTARPTTAAQTINCTGKAPLSITAPRLQVKFADGAGANPSALNYCYIPLFARYYWVNSWTNDGPLWVADLTVDALASWKTQLGANHLYIYRADSGWNGQIPDNLYPVTSRVRKFNVTIPKIWTVGGANAAGASADTGIYIAGVVGSNATRYYAFPTELSWRGFLAALFDDAFYTSILGEFGATEYPEAKVAISPMQYITSAFFVPIGLIDSGYWGIRHEAAVTSIPVGPVSVNVLTAYPLTEFATSFSVFDIDTTASDFEHPQAADRGIWLNLAPYCSYELFYPPFGIIDLDPAAIAAHDTLRLRVTLDARTCECMLEVQVLDTAANIRTIYRATASFGVSLPLSNIIQPGTSATQILSAGLGGVVSGVVSMVAGDATGALGVLGGVSAAIGTAVKGRIPHVSTMGGPGSTAGLDGNPKLYVTQWYLADDDPAGRGRPLCGVRQVSAIPGYIMGDPDEVAIPCTAEELTEIKNAVGRGFFYE